MGINKDYMYIIELRLPDTDKIMFYNCINKKQAIFLYKLLRRKIGYNKYNVILNSLNII